MEIQPVCFVQVVGPTTISPKVGTTSSEKKVDDKNDSNTTQDEVKWEDSADYDIRDDVPFQLKATIAQDYDNYKVYKLTFHDKESAGLTFKPETVVVKIDDVIVHPKFDKHDEPGGPDDDTITRKVLKVWKDDSNEKERPKEVIVQLLRDGKVYDTVTLNKANNWRHTWNNLDASYRWTIVEKELDDYTVEVTREGITFVVTNTYTDDIPDNPPPTGPTTPTDPTPPKPGKPTLPQTGQLWWPVPVLTAAGLLLVIAGLLRRRGAENEK